MSFFLINIIKFSGWLDLNKVIFSVVCFVALSFNVLAGDGISVKIGNNFNDFSMDSERVFGVSMEAENGKWFSDCWLENKKRENPWRLRNLQKRFGKVWNLESSSGVKWFFVIFLLISLWGRARISVLSFIFKQTLNNNKSQNYVCLCFASDE